MVSRIMKMCAGVAFYMLCGMQTALTLMWSKQKAGRVNWNFRIGMGSAKNLYMLESINIFQ